MLPHLSGYRPADGCEPVAQAGALRRPRGTDYGVANFPEAMLAHLSGLPACKRL
ncbi:TPA: hypothetical protein QHO11_002704 [Klebsiella oxytoca]|nr:hypothetical protein [Klebsiella oxytoca]MDM4094583.1 hypothetical protein [Klebsiella oxytoca]HDT4622363.1 hypothetical protein [Klebsiella oxytoca]